MHIENQCWLPTYRFAPIFLARCCLFHCFELFPVTHQLWDVFSITISSFFFHRFLIFNENTIRLAQPRSLLGLLLPKVCLRLLPLPLLRTSGTFVLVRGRRLLDRRSQGVLETASSRLFWGTQTIYTWFCALLGIFGHFLTRRPLGSIFCLF